MNAFIVEIANRPGQLARVTGALGDAGVNITTGAGIGLSDSGGFGFVTDDEAGARKALEGAGIMFRTVDVVAATVRNEAGGLAEAARKLAGAGVNIQFVVPMLIGGDRVGICIGVDNAEAARTALGDLAAAD